jgi:hypothetical protein
VMRHRPGGGHSVVPRPRPLPCRCTQRCMPPAPPPAPPWEPCKRRSPTDDTRADPSTCSCDTPPARCGGCTRPRLAHPRKHYRMKLLLRIARVP